jgi:mono/diheme cytochrome c family protein
MSSTTSSLRRQALGLFAFILIAGLTWTARFVSAQPAATPPRTVASAKKPTPAPAPAVAVPAVNLEPGFQEAVKPFLQKNCAGCHNADNMIAGVRVDHLDTSLDDKHIRIWEGIRHRVESGTMPPKGMPQPSAADREKVVGWVKSALEVARLRPSPLNGGARRLTVSQYKNTLRELLQLEDNLTEILPPDAVSSDGFVNNKDTLQLSPLLLESYLEIAETALNRAIVDEQSKPKVQNFRMDLGAAINPKPFPEKLILGANSRLLENQDFMVTELTPKKPFAYDPFFMRTKYRFIEGYAGNDTVRGWRDYDSIYHAVFACVRGSNGYPKGSAYSLVPQGLLLRPSIPNEELFEQDGTFGHKPNFKVSLRELPDQGRFRVTVMAARYNDGLLLDPGVAPQTAAGISLPLAGEKKAQSVVIPKAGIYQVDVHAAARPAAPKPDATRLSEGLTGSWNFNDKQGSERLVASPFGQALSLDGTKDTFVVAKSPALDVADGDFTVSAWIRPGQVRKGAILSRGAYEYTQGWYLDIADNRGTLRLQTSDADGKSQGSISSTPGVIRANVWQHVTAVVRRGKKESLLYVNGYAVGKGEIAAADLDNPKLDLTLGHQKGGAHLQGELDDVRLYRRALVEAEIQALLEPGRQFVKAPPERPQELTLNLGEREFLGTLKQPAFLAVRLEAGTLPVKATLSGMNGLERIVFTPLAEAQDLATKFLAFEKRVPRMGVHLGLRRDCGSTFSPVGEPQKVSGSALKRYIFEGEISNFPSPNVEKDNVNYLAGVREIAVRSEYTDGRDMPRMLVKSVEFEGPFFEAWPPPAHKNIFIESEKKNDKPAYAKQIIRSFATKAYRRPLSAAEEAALVAVFTKSFSGGRDFQQSIKDTLEVVLTSPQFLFLVENSASPKPEPISSSELASKLSYFLWNGPPDATTLRLAASGQLSKQLDSELERMIQDPRFTRFTQEFASQWLALDKFSVLEPDRKRYPGLTRDTRTQLKQEPIQFVQHLMRANLPVKNLIDSDFIMANEVVATYYDLGNKTESGFNFVAIPHGRKELGGVLTQASILAGLSDGRESNPVKRGAWLARRIIAEPPADPPPNVPALKEETKDLTLRQRLEMHRNQTACSQCHAKIDPWGVALEEFDAGGRLKQQATDARSRLPDQTEVSGANDLKRYLSEDRIDQVAFSVLKHLATYANGRSLTYNEVNFLKQEGLQLKAGGYRMKDMLRFVVKSKLFLEK